MTNLFFPFLLIATIFINTNTINAQVEGRILLTSMGTDVEYRVGRTAAHLTDYKPELMKQADSGESLLKALEGTEENAGEAISVWVNFSHGNNECLFAKDHRKKLCYYSSGLSLFPKDRSTFATNRSFGDLKWAVEHGKIQFAEDALIVVHACVAGSLNEKQGMIYAQELSDITGATVIAGQHQTEPVIEDEQDMIYSNVHEFVVFRPNETPVLIGDELNLTKLLKDYIKSQGTYTLADYPHKKWEPNLGNRDKAAYLLPAIPAQSVSISKKTTAEVKNTINLPKRNNKEA